MLTYWVGGSENVQKPAYVIFEWSLRQSRLIEEDKLRIATIRYHQERQRAQWVKYCLFTVFGCPNLSLFRQLFFRDAEDRLKAEQDRQKAQQNAKNP